MKRNFINTGIYLLFSFIIYVLLYFLIKERIINPYYARILNLMGINIILAVSLNLIMGFTGQLALGHAGFMSIGAYSAAIFSLKLHAPFPIALLAGGLFAAVISLLIALPTLRLKGDYLAITTLGFGQIIMVVINNIDALGGARGIAGIPPKTTFTWVFFVMILSILIIYNIIHSSQGRAMLSVREDEISAAAMGINTTKYKIMAFVIGSFFAGVAGGLFAHFNMFIQPSSFDFLMSVNIVTFVVLGGMGSLSASILSAGVLTYLPEWLRFLNDYRMVIYPIALIIIMLFRPQGIMGSKEVTDLFKFKQRLIKRSDKNAITESE